MRFYVTNCILSLSNGSSVLMDTQFGRFQQFGDGPTKENVTLWRSNCTVSESSTENTEKLKEKIKELEH
ncbi:17631_t:CDS:2, partial [Acaulospora morrowiae]